MSVTIDDLVEQAKQLTIEQQAILSERIFEMVSPPDAEWETALVAECQDRIAAIERGEMMLLDADEVMGRLRQKHGIK